MSQPHSSPAVEEVVRAGLTFTVRQDTKPYFKSSALTGAEPEVHFRTEQREVAIHDMRPCAATLALDVQGFVLRHAPTSVTDLHDDGLVETVYEAELRTLLREATGARRVGIFDYTRRADSAGGAANPDGFRGPASRVHVDYTIRSGPVRARDALGADVFDEVLAGGGRVMQVNVWRPIRGPVRRTPLALADASSVAPGELIATDQIFPDRVGEIYQLAYGPAQRWFFAPEMTPDEVLLIKGWDSLDDGRARFTPHGAFKHPAQTTSTPPRESIEARAYLLFDA